MDDQEAAEERRPRSRRRDYEELRFDAWALITRAHNYQISGWEGS
jgi:hypothetical protein